MSKFRFREYDALGLRQRVPGDPAPSAHHISKRKLKQKDVEVAFDQNDYTEYVTGFRKRKQQRRQDALKQVKDKERLERNQHRADKRAKLKEELGLGDNFGVESSSDDEAAEAAAQPKSVAVYQNEGGLTTTVTTMALHSSDDEAPAGSGEGEEGEESEEEQRGGAVARPSAAARRGGSARGAAVARPGSGKPVKTHNARKGAKKGGGSKSGKQRSKGGSKGAVGGVMKRKR